MRVTWLVDVLKTVGLNVVEVPAWRGRGRDLGAILGILAHHTAGSKNGNMPSLNMLIKGRPDLPGPLCQIALGRDGTVYLVADGRANHAGIGNWHGITMGNSSMIGIEAENEGTPDDLPWPQVQMDAYQRICAAIAEHLGFSKDANDTNASDHIAGHKEFALPKGRKSDPDFDMNEFRASVQKLVDANSEPSTSANMAN